MKKRENWVKHPTGFSISMSVYKLKANLCHAAARDEDFCFHPSRTYVWWPESESPAVSDHPGVPGLTSGTRGLRQERIPYPEGFGGLQSPRVSPHKASREAPHHEATGSRAHGTSAPALSWGCPVGKGPQDQIAHLCTTKGMHRHFFSR